VHYADLNNDLGIPGISGTQFQEAARAQAQDAGVALHALEVTAVGANADGLTATVAAGEAFSGDYLIL
jgi:thioredoxin reductase (NADPH)